MTGTVRVVCSPAVRDGFELAGVHAISAVDGDEAAAVLGRLVEQGGAGVILVEETLHRALPEELRRALERRALPVIVPFPGPRRAGEGPPSAAAELAEILRGAIGYRVRLR